MGLANISTTASYCPVDDNVKRVAKTPLPWLIAIYSLGGVMVLNCRTTKDLFHLSYIKRIGLVLACLIWHSPSSAQTFLNPSDVITTSDYPPNSWKRGDQGITHFRLSLGTNGQATGCTIVESSGFEELDNATCRLMVERAKFDMSTVFAANTEATYSNRVRWQLPAIDPRVLLFGVTAKRVPVRSDATKIKCEYSDGLHRIIDANQSCNREIPVLVTNQKGRKIKSNIFNQYIKEVDEFKNGESAYNLSVILAQNNYYKQSAYYMQKSSSLGYAFASASLCLMHSSKLHEDFVEFNPNQALEYCILSYKQSYNRVAILIFEKIKKDYEFSLDKQILEKARTTIVLKNQTSNAQSMVAGNEIIRPKDYPRRDNSNQVGGVTVAILGIEKTGKVGTCLIEQSTYSYSLDQKACSRLKEAAMYTPAIIDGVPAMSWTSQTVRWNPSAPSQQSPGSIIMQILLGALGAAI